MTNNQIHEREQLVPQDYLVRKLDTAIDFTFIYPLVKDLYSTIGRPSIDPVVLFNLTGDFSILSMRQTIKESK